MRHSETIADLAAALSAAQGEMPAAPLDGRNPHFNSRYATLTGLVTTARPVLARHGLSVVQGRGEGGGIETTILHSSGQWITCDGEPLSPVKADPQGIASAITYARRYGLAAACGLVADDDDDGNAATAGKASERPQDASTPRSDVRHPEPAKGVNADPSGVNAALLQDKAPASVVGRVNSDITAKTIPVNGHNVDISEFNLIREDGVIHKVTAWDKARDVADTLSMGEAVHVTGKWHIFKNIVAIDAREIVTVDSSADLPF